MRLLRLRGGYHALLKRSTAPLACHRNLGLDEQNSTRKRDKKQQHEGFGRALIDTKPKFIEHRIRIWDRCKAESTAWLEARPKTPIVARVRLNDQDVREGPKELKFEAISWQTTPLAIATQIDTNLANQVLVAKVNNELWDLERPLERDDSVVQFLRFEHDEGQQVYWHSSAHVLGQAMERTYGALLCYGPAIDDGFYYDMFLKENRQVLAAEYANLERLAMQIIGEGQRFERLVLRKADLLEMFAYNEFKCRIIKQKVSEPLTTVYRCGPLIDLCRGPHLRTTGHIREFKVTKHSVSHWEGDVNAETLQRVYGISFPDKKLLKEWNALHEEAAKRDHRKIGREQQLFFFHELSPGSCFFLPRGAHIYNTLVDFIRSEYRKRGYEEVVSPNLYSSKLWERSGHWDHYSDHMFKVEIENETCALKPMNCPGHCLIFAHRPRSWRELPIRIADFGVLHRNELSGALTGLTRVRRFQQDDAHIFCRPDQIKDEIRGVLDFLQFVYKIFGFKLMLILSTRPDKYLGDIEQWNSAESQLQECLNELREPWKLNPGDGAFYGPKIDIMVLDALKRKHQCATIQLDFQLPIRFDLSYATGEEQQLATSPSSTNSGFETAKSHNEEKSGDAVGSKKKRPVIIHRAILGSVERMMAILTENYGGKWPFWLSPRQAVIVPVASAHDQYALSVFEHLKKAGFQVEAQLDPSLTLNKKVRNAQVAQFNFILVVGDKEVANGTVSVRTRDNKVHGQVKLDTVIDKFQRLNTSRVSNAEELFDSY